MRKIHFLPAALLIGMVACNNADNKAAAGTDTAKSATDTGMVMAHTDSTQAVPPLPAVPAGAKVFFKNLKNGQTVASPLKIEMGIEGLKLDTAGAIVSGSGHHHLLIDAGDSIPAGQVVPKDATHLHFGNAQSATEVKLAPGKHVLTLQFADGIHRSYGGKLATTINVTVK
ncbi:DUF4399 domain-containing protein [Puia sp.]|jgi:hypothetical protein|uniref:DUF4399 domain-containing protein n=1 Tax=Puia sp. TaxID=2045100 RepID=UPI002F3E4944